jgi:hypothetical protein
MSAIMGLQCGKAAGVARGDAWQTILGRSYVHRFTPGPLQSSNTSAMYAQQFISRVQHNFPQAQRSLPRVNVRFRVLIVGRANAGKTSILQRVCDTTESPEIYRIDSSGSRELVRSPS